MFHNCAIFSLIKESFIKQSPTLREAKESDLDAVIKLVKNLGLEQESTLNEVSEKWHHYWNKNPIKQSHLKAPPLGWVLEANSQIVGFFGNLPRIYHFRGKDYTVCVSSTWGVLPEYRSDTKRLSEANFSQENTDIFLVTTGIHPVERHYLQHNGRHIQPEEMNTVLFKVLQPHAFISSLLMKKDVPKVIIRFISCILFLPFSIFLYLKQEPLRSISRFEKNLSTRELEHLGEEFDDLWARISGKSQKILGHRNLESLKWSLEIAKQSQSVHILTFTDEKSLRGYLIYSSQTTSTIALKRARIIDIFVEDDDEETILALANRAIQISTETGCSVIELASFPSNIRRMLGKILPLKRRYDSFPFNFIAINESIKEVQDEDCWYLTFYDGDSFF